MPQEINIPRHIAIIMDGNGRWATEKGLSRTAGHKEGTKRIREVIKAADEFGVRVLTLFAFSTENWNRPKKEIEILMRYLDSFLDHEAIELHENNMRLLIIGRDEPLPQYIQDKIRKVQAKTKDNTGLTLVLALNYGARQELVDAFKKIIPLVTRGEIALESVDENIIAKFLYTYGLPDPDLLIRTSGEMRLSNFLLWQLSYAEMYFPKKYWPDFTRDDLEKAIKEYKSRSRRFGGI
ncbi:MAG: isoprenyl transferase [Candidatus Omnitrophota bacterium]|jgi:undecaprenyl diphosphate synthase|nr:MAG: isoprenyl transferase [Candidatus Omnitrophota bacterium]